MPTAKTGARAHTPYELPTETFTAFAGGLTDAASRNRDAWRALVLSGAKESQRLLDEMTRTGAHALEELKDCQSPLEVLRVEQTWFMDNCGACLASGLRFMQAAQDAAGRPQA